MDFDKLSEKWEAERLFWSASGRPDTFDLEEAGYGYDSYQKMVKQHSDTYSGDWVRAEDYQRDVEVLERRIRELEQNWYNCLGGRSLGD
jgi:hypothetical protein